MNDVFNLKMPLEIRWHGRGGQGAVTAAKLLASVALGAGWSVQSFPQFGSERRGAPIQAFTRIDDKPITLYSSIREPEVLIVLDSSLLWLPPTLAGIKAGGLLLVNAETEEGMPELEGVTVATVPATSIAIKHLGRPVTNTAMLGGLIGCTNLFDLAVAKELVEHAFAGEFSPNVVEANVRAITDAAEQVCLKLAA